MRKGDTYTIFFAAAVCVVCSLLLSGTSAMLKKRQDLMVELDRKMNVLKAFQTPVTDEKGKKISATKIDEIFKAHITEIFLDGQTGQILSNPTPEQLSKDRLEKKETLPLFLWRDGDEVTRYAFPVSGKGLWSTIYGYMALDKDLCTIMGITFYRHGETPGLGGEISTDWFQRQFKGKKVFENGKSVRIEVVKGLVKNKYPEGSDRAVNGITGATLTGNGLNRFINEDLEKYEKYFRGIRKS